MVLICGDSLTSGNIGIGFPACMTGFKLLVRGIDGDTTRGVLHRSKRYLANSRDARDIDTCIIECGGNDVLLPYLLEHGSREWVEAARALTQKAQPPCTSTRELIELYAQELPELLALQKRIEPSHLILSTIPPFGEIPHEPLEERRLACNEVIREVATSFGTSLADLDLALADLRKPSSSSYLLVDPGMFTEDARRVGRDPVKADLLSRERGLHFTIDGIHLNSIGAKRAAKTYTDLINRLANSSQQI